MAISIEQVKELREVTGAGVLDCRKTLEQVDGDLKKAIEILREKGLAKAAKREERETSEGVLDLYSHGNGRIGVMVELNCETDFVARSPVFRELAHEIALQVAAAAPLYVYPDDIPEEVLQQERQSARQLGIDEGKPEAIIDRIVEGRLEKFRDETCLLRQTYVRDDSITIQDLLNQYIASTGEKIVVGRFVRWEVGETA
ncbi:MAG: translation elongation factor Ts [Anaerolineales bacterium]|nr:translation elongation factor Ts [Anaerolineales bacterium]